MKQKRRHPCACQSSSAPLGAAACPMVESLDARVLLSFGDPDPTFGTDGQLVHRSPVIPTALALQADGKILFVGWGLSDAGSVVRLNPDGSTDTSFGTAGLASSNQGTFSTGLAVNASGRIAVSGIFQQYDPKYGLDEATLAVYTPAGKLDTTFAGDGTISTAAFGPAFDDVAVQPDGKVLVVGRKLVRYTAGGTPDTSFSGDGVVDTGGKKVLVDATGRVLVLGHFALFRFNPDGTPDSTFDGDGVLPNVKGTDLALAPDGDILVAGNGPYANFVSRFNSNGSVDAAFGHQGSATVPGNVLAVTGRNVFVGGYVTDATNPGADPASRQTILFALTPTGQTDASFGRGGQVSSAAQTGIVPVDMGARGGGLLVLGPADVVLDNPPGYHEIHPALARYQIVADITPSPSQQQPFTGVPFELPGTLQLENFDKGGEGVTFHDTDTVNQGGAYRTESADTQAIPASAGGGYSLAFTRPGEWTEYTFNAAADQAGRYDLILRYAAPLEGGSFRLDLDGRAITAPTPAFATGGWQTYKTLTFYDMNFAPGTHVLRLSQYNAGSYGYVANFDSIQFNRHRLPRPGSPWIPGQTIDAEDYDEGSEGATYHDTEPADLGGGNIYKGEGVDVEGHLTPSGAYYANVAYTKAGEWLEYTVQNPNPTDLLAALDVRLASLRPGGRFHLTLDGTSVASFAAPATGSWQTYTTLTSPKTIRVTPGTHVLRLTMDQNNTIGYVANFDWLRLAP